MKKRNNILENIAQIRKNKRFTQAYIAEKLGMKQAGYGLIETGERGLQYEVLLQIADALDVDVIDIILHPDEYIKPEDANKPKSPKVTLQIDIDQDDIKADVIRLAFGDRIVKIKNE